MNSVSNLEPNFQEPNYQWETQPAAGQLVAGLLDDFLQQLPFLQNFSHACFLKQVRD